MRHVIRFGTRATAAARRALSAVALLIALLLGLEVTTPALQAQSRPAKEFQVKALFLLNFLQYVEWPAKEFADETAPLRIGILGPGPIADELAGLVEGEKVRQRPLVLVRVERLQDLTGCHVLLVGRSARPQVASIIQACERKPVLTVADFPDFARRGGLINFYLEGQKVRFEINRAAAQQNGLKISSQLLALARIVGPSMASQAP